MAEVSPKVAESIGREFTDEHIVKFYEILLQDKEPEVRSEAVGRIAELGCHCSAS